MEKPKICIVVNDLAVGGLPSVVLSILQQIDHLKFQFYLLNLSKQEGILDQKVLPKSVIYQSIPIEFPSAYGLMDHLKFAFFPKQTNNYAKPVVDYLIKINADIIHFHSQPRQLEIGYQVKAINPNLKIVFNEHVKRFSKGDYSWYQRKILGIAFRRHFRDCKIVAISKSVRNYISDIGVKSERVVLIRNRIDMNKFKNLNPTPTPPYNVLNISRMSLLKRQHILIDAWKKLIHPLKGKLILVGPDESNGEILEITKDDPSVSLAGSQSKIVDYLEKADIIVLPSAKEGLPLTLLESMASSKAVIISDIEEHTSILDHRVSALYFELDNVSDLVSKMEELMNNPRLIIELGRNARALAEDDFNAENWGNDYQDLYQNVLSEG